MIPETLVRILNLLIVLCFCILFLFIHLSIYFDDNWIFFLHLSTNILFPKIQKLISNSYMLKNIYGPSQWAACNETKQSVVFISCPFSRSFPLLSSFLSFQSILLGQSLFFKTRISILGGGNLFSQIVREIGISFS